MRRIEVFSALWGRPAIPSVDLTAQHLVGRINLEAVSDGNEDSVSWIGELEKRGGDRCRAAGGVGAGRDWWVARQDAERSGRSSGRAHCRGATRRIGIRFGVRLQSAAKRDPNRGRSRAGGVVNQHVVP
jgi:hypothetical protein